MWTLRNSKVLKQKQKSAEWRITMGDGYKKLTRSRTNRTICGVCGGIGDYLNVDPTLVRLIWLLCSLGSCGTGLIIYIVASLIIPEDNDVVL